MKLTLKDVEDGLKKFKFKKRKDLRELDEMSDDEYEMQERIARDKELSKYIDESYPED